MTKTKAQTVDLKTLIGNGKFSYVNSNITSDNFPTEAIRSNDYKVFHFDKYITSEDAVKEIEKEGFSPANIYELLSWSDWNGKDTVVGLGSSCVVGDDRRVPGLSGWVADRSLSLGWWGGEWGGVCRFLAVRNGSETLETKNSTDLSSSAPQTLCLHCNKELKLVIEKA